MKAIALALVLVLVAQAKKEDKKNEETGVLEVTRSTEELTKDFKDDPAKARKFYNPNPPQKDAKGGTIINIDGPAKDVKGKAVTFKDQNGITIILTAKNVEGQVPAEKFAGAAKGAKFKSYDEKKKELHLDADEVKFEKIIGKE